MMWNETYQTWQHPSNLVQLAAIGLLCFAVFLWYRRFLRIGAGAALLLMLVTALLGLTFASNGFPPFRHGPLISFGLQSGPFVSSGFWSPYLEGYGPGPLNPIIYRWLFLVFTVPFLAKLYLKWVRGRLTEPEKEDGQKAIQAWFSGGNLVCVFLIAFWGMLGFGYSFIGLLVLGVAALLLYPIITLTTQPVGPVSDSAESLTEERERILKMLEDGKINAEESAELLNALGATVRLPAHRSHGITSAQRLIVIGAALVVIGFSLPWFSFYRGQSIPWFLVLLLALSAALMPWLGQQLNSQTQKRITLWTIIAGALVLSVLVFPNLHSISVGVLVAFLGIGLELIGAVREARAG